LFISSGAGLAGFLPDLFTDVMTTSAIGKTSAWRTSLARVAPDRFGQIVIQYEPPMRDLIPQWNMP
jgi:hypothetical protein